MTPSRTTTSHRAARGLIALLFSATLLTGCGSDDDAATSGPDTSPSEAPAATQTTPTEAAPTVIPASGPKISVRGLRAHAPKGWEAKLPYAVMQAAVPPGMVDSAVYVFRFPNSGLLSFDALARTQRSMTDWKFKLERLDDIVLNSEPVFHLAGKANPGEYIERFGAIVNDDRLTLTFEFANGEGPAVRSEIINSVLATVAFREVGQ